jgi:TIR domain
VSAGPDEPASTSTHRVFISYRRQDSAAYAGRLYDAMVARFGERNVFMDLDLPPGVDFVERITEAVSACQVLIEVIGPTWATVKDDEGRIRIADPEDFVRLELEIALKRPEVTVIPVLVSGAQMPDRRDLPPELGAIARRNALELSDKRWRYDVGQLISTLEELLAETTAVHAAPATEDVVAAATASPVSAPTGPAPRPAGTGDRGRAGEWLRGHGRLLAGVAALAVVGVVLAIVALGSGSDGGDNPSPEFKPFTGADEFQTVEVPAGWSRTDKVQIEGGVKTVFTYPNNRGNVEVLRESPAPSVQGHAEDVLSLRHGDGATVLKHAELQNLGDREAWLIEYEWNEDDVGPATVAADFFNAGGYGWRTRAAVAKAAADDSAKLAEETANRMANTLEP